MSITQALGQASTVQTSAGTIAYRERGKALGIRTMPWVRADLRRILLAVDDDHMFRAAAGLASFEKPALVVWGADDVLFPPVYGRLLSGLLPRGRFLEIPDCMTFVPEEQPEKLVELIKEFVQ